MGRKKVKFYSTYIFVCSVPAISYCNQALLYLLVQRGFLKTCLEFFFWEKVPLNMKNRILLKYRISQFCMNLLQITEQKRTFYIVIL